MSPRKKMLSRHIE